MTVLKVCVNVTNLYVCARDILLDLDTMSQCLPQLKDINVEVTRYCGSRCQLAHLVSYELSLYKNDSFNPTLIFELIFTAFASTLERLSIIRCEMTDVVDYPEFRDDVPRFQQPRSHACFCL